MDSVSEEIARDFDNHPWCELNPDHSLGGRETSRSG